jgi:hypothetical protein
MKCVEIRPVEGIPEVVAECERRRSQALTHKV